MKYELTKEYLLSKINQEDIFAFYLSSYGISVNGLRYKSPFRRDNVPSCTFVYGKSMKLLFRDWSLNKSYDCFDVVMNLFNINFGQALHKINNDLVDIKLKNYDKNIKRNNDLEDIKRNSLINSKEIKIKRKLFTKKELDFWNIEGLNITPKILMDNKIYSIEVYWINENIFRPTSMTFAYHFTNYDYQIYSPQNKKGLKFMSPNNIKIGDEEFIDKNANYLVITKSKKDSFYMRLLGINTIFVISESTIIDDFTMDLLLSKYKRIFTLFDNDLIGVKYSNIYRKKFKTKPLLFSRKLGKDFTDVLKKIGLTEMKELINKTKKKWYI